MLRSSRLIAPLSRKLFSTSSIKLTDPFPSILADVSSPLEVTSVLRSGQGFKLRTLDDPIPRTIHGNLLILDGEYFLWRPKLHCPQSGILDISPDSWGIFDVVAPKPVLGTGDRIMFVRRARETLAKIGIQLDVQDTKNAASMFNLLQAEGRSVAAALLAQKTIEGIKVDIAV